MKKARAMFDGLTEDEKKQLSSLLEKMMEHWPGWRKEEPADRGWQPVRQERFSGSRQRTRDRGPAPRRKDGRQTFPIKSRHQRKGQGAYFWSCPCFVRSVYCPLCAKKIFDYHKKI